MQGVSARPRHGAAHAGAPPGSARDAFCGTWLKKTGLRRRGAAKPGIYSEARGDSGTILCSPALFFFGKQGVDAMMLSQVMSIEKR
jgi:hypothetical protein